jgi:hypothetical protein
LERPLELLLIWLGLDPYIRFPHLLGLLRLFGYFLRPNTS